MHSHVGVDIVRNMQHSQHHIFVSWSLIRWNASGALNNVKLTFAWGRWDAVFDCGATNNVYLTCMGDVGCYF